MREIGPLNVDLPDGDCNGATRRGRHDGLTQQSPLPRQAGAAGSRPWPAWGSPAELAGTSRGLPGPVLAPGSGRWALLKRL